MKPPTRLMSRPLAYRLWQSPFAEAKLAPIRRHNDLSAVRRVLDVGCGPGTNARHFAAVEYLGLDISADYVAYACRKYGDRFVVADVRRDAVPEGPSFDFILVNSLLHHLGTSDVRRILSQISTRLTPDGHVHILDLVLPDHAGPARLLARWDRGDYPRSLSEWRTLLSDAFEPILVEPYRLPAFGPTLWEMVYFKGRRRT